MRFRPHQSHVPPMKLIMNITLKTMSSITCQGKRSLCTQVRGGICLSVLKQAGTLGWKKTVKSNHFVLHCPFFFNWKTCEELFYNTKKGSRLPSDVFMYVFMISILTYLFLSSFCLFLFSLRTVVTLNSKTGSYLHAFEMCIMD